MNSQDLFEYIRIKDIKNLFMIAYLIDILNEILIIQRKGHLVMYWSVNFFVKIISLFKDINQREGIYINH